MNFKIVTPAAVAAALVFSFAGPSSSGAFAQVAQPATGVPAEASAPTTEVVPQFVSREVVQPLPEAEPAPAPAKPASARSLEALIADTDVSGLDEQLHCLAGAIYFEARGEPLEGQLAVAQVVVNRAESGRFPATYCGVVKQAGQFSFVKRGRIPQPATASTAWRKARAIARIAHEGSWDSRAGESLFFHATHVSPNWRAKRVATISRHVFYR